MDKFKLPERSWRGNVEIGAVVHELAIRPLMEYGSLDGAFVVSRAKPYRDLGGDARVQLEKLADFDVGPGEDRPVMLVLGPHLVLRGHDSRTRADEFHPFSHQLHHPV